MAPILLFLLGALVSAQQGGDSVRPYPGLYSNEVMKITQIFDNFSTETPGLQFGATESTTQEPKQETRAPEEPSRGTDATSTTMPHSVYNFSTETPGLQFGATESTTQEPKQETRGPDEPSRGKDATSTTMSHSEYNSSYVEKTYYKVIEKQSQQVVTHVVQERHGSHPCIRECQPGTAPMRCHYVFMVEWYRTMSKACYSCPFNKTDCERKDCVPADGMKRSIATVNRQLPGPSVEVCVGDTIIADVVNHLMGETTTIHWHGQHQKDTPYMDGVPYVTQCPISPNTKYRYTFKAEQSGTHFWHSHTGLQRADGMFGALIVRTPRSLDPHAGLYDFDLSEHIIQVLDWNHKLGIDKFLANHHSNGTNKPISLLVNGKGWVGGHRNMPAAKFTVQQGYRYRFRVINAGFLNCPVELSVDNHTIVVISSDGRDVHPVTATSLVSYAGERFDFILDANQNISNYWIRFRGLMDCDERYTSTHQVAKLQYVGAPANVEPEGTVDYESSHRDGMQINSLNVGPGTELSTVMSELNSTEEDDISLKPKADVQVILAYDFHDKDNPHYHKSSLYGFKDVPDVHQQLYTPQLNHISMKLQPFALLSGRHLIKPEMFCNASTVSNCENTFCECTHVTQVARGEVVEIVLIDKGVTYDANHPFHIHGHTFRVVAMGRVGNSTTVEEIKKLDEQGQIKRKLKGAALKDTVTVPDGGYTIIRFHAYNPGYWLFHCHLEFHVELGMSMVFKVGEDSEMPPVPSNFPQCSDYVPEVDIETMANTDKENEVPFQRLIQMPSSSAKQTVASTLIMILLSCFFL